MTNPAPQDALDRILFETAEQATAGMDFPAAWAQIQAEYRRARRRKAISRYAPMAATLVVGLGLGLLLAPTQLPKSASTYENAPAQAADAIPEAGGLQSIPESEMTDAPADYIIVDPPKTSPGIEESIPGEARAFPNLLGKADIRQLCPTWLPEEMDYISVQLAGNSWQASGPAGNAFGYASLYAELTMAGDMLDVPVLDIGEGAPTYLRMEGEDAPSCCEWRIRLAEDTYLYVYGEYVDFADVERVLDSLGQAENA